MSAEYLVSCLEALEDVDSAATTVSGERCDVANAHLIRLVGVRRGAFGDALRAGAALLKEVTTTELAVEGALRVGSVASRRHGPRRQRSRQQQQEQRKP